MEALKFLADRAGVQLPSRNIRKKKKTDESRSRLLEVNKEAAKYFYYQMKSSGGQAAFRYLTSRGLTEEIIKRFGLGYSNRYRDDLYRYLKSWGIMICFSTV